MKVTKRNVLSKIRTPNSSIHSQSNKCRNAFLSATQTSSLAPVISWSIVSLHSNQINPNQIKLFTTQKRKLSTEIHEFESDLKKSSNAIDAKSALNQKKLDQILYTLQHDAQGHYTKTLDLLSELYKNKIPLNHETATAFLESLFNCKRLDQLEYFFHKWFKNSISPKPLFDRSWMKYIVGMYDLRKLDSGLLKDMIQNAHRLLPHEQKFTPSEEDYMFLITSYSKIGIVNKFMEAREGMKIDLQLPEKDEPWLVACSMALLKQSGNKDGVMKIFISHFDSKLKRNPGLPLPSMKEYVILMSIFSAKGDVEKCKEIFSAAETDLGSLNHEYRMLTLLIQAYITNNDVDNAWIIYKQFFRTFEQGEPKDKLFPDSVILSILLDTFIRVKDHSMIQRIITISNHAIKEDRNKKLESSQQFNNNTTISKTEEILIDSIINIKKNYNENIDEDSFENEDDEEIITYNNRSFKLDFQFSIYYIKACLALEKPDMALDHFKRYYKSSISLNPKDPLLLLPTLGFYGRVMHEFLFVYHPNIVEQLYICAQEDFPIDIISNFSSLNHAILILYLREKKFDKMMKIYEERFKSSLTENSKNNPLILKNYVAKEIMTMLLQEGKIEDLNVFLDILLQDLPRRDPRHYFIHLFNESTSKKLNHGAVLDYFLLKSNYMDSNDLSNIETTLDSIFASALKEGNVTQIISWFSEMPPLHQCRTKIASIYVSALLRASTIHESWNEFLRIYKLPKQLKPMILPYVNISKDYNDTSNIKKSSPDEVTYTVMLNALSLNGVIENTKQLLECIQIDHPKLYSRLYHFYIIALAKKGKIEEAYKEMDQFYVGNIQPPSKLLKELIFESPVSLINEATKAFNLFKKLYPKDSNLEKLNINLQRKQKNEQLAQHKQQNSKQKIEPAQNIQTAYEEQLVYNALPESEKNSIENIMKLVHAYIREKQFENALELLPINSDSKQKIRKEDYALILQEISKAGNLHHMKEILTHAKLDGYSAIVFADDIVNGLLEANLIREAVAFFKKLYQTSLGQGATNASKPSRNIYLNLIRSLRKIALNDEEMSSILMQVQKSFNAQYPPLLSKKSKERVKERLEQV